MRVIETLARNSWSLDPRAWTLATNSESHCFSALPQVRPRESNKCCFTKQVPVSTLPIRALARLPRPAPATHSEHMSALRLRRCIDTEGR
eukprot:308515-Rhodomonas_salina.1